MLGSRVRSPGGSRKKLQNTFWSLFFVHILDTSPSFSGNVSPGMFLRESPPRPQNAPIRGQMPPAGTIHPHQAPSVWTKVISRTKLPQKAPPVWTGGNYFSSASTKTPPSVDKCHLRAPYIHTRHPLCGQAATISPPHPQKHPIRGQMPPAGTIHPHQAPSAWTSGNSGHLPSTKDTRFVDKTLLLIYAGFRIILYFCRYY